jgi:hypothetical protein
MAFLLPHSVFIHSPKTGGQWVVRTLEKSGLIVGKLGVVHTNPAEVFHELAFQQRKFVFTMVRHPLSWYQSMWTHRVDENWIPINAPEWFTPRWVETWAEFTRHCRANRFDEFIYKCASHFPDGYVSMLYESYTEGCSYVGKQERLVESLLTALRLSGEQFQEQQIRSTPPRNVRARRPSRLLQCMYMSDLVDIVMKTEAWAIEKFDYQDLPQGIMPESIHT